MLSLERYHCGACVLPSWELRITQRCLTADLSLGTNTGFKAARAHPIVAAFESKRSMHTGAGKTVGPAAGDKSFFHLGIGDDHRGATWFQSKTDVVWLCAYRFHRSRSDDDFFKWVQPLIDDGSLLPTGADIGLLVRERALRFRHMAPIHAAQIMEKARGSGQVIEGQLADEVGVRVKVEASGADEFVSVAFSGLLGARSNDVVAAFDP